MSNNNNSTVTINGKLYNINTTTKLNLSGANLSSLPASIGNLKNLKELSLNNNELTSLPESIGNLKNLEYLNFYNNKLTSLPASICNLTNLKELSLSENNLISLPKRIGNLKKLFRLFMYGNELTSLPASIGNLTNLEMISMAYNELTSLPTSIGNLKNLVYIDLSYNNLTSLPESFKNLRSDIEITYNENTYNRNSFIPLFKPKRVSKNTELFNIAFSETTKISDIPKNKRVYIKKNSNVKNDGELRRLYNKNGMNRYMSTRNQARLHGNVFTKNNIEKLTNKNIVNKNVYLRNFKNRLINLPLNNLNDTVKKIKTNLPSNISQTDVNTIVRSMKPRVLQKIFNKLKNSPSNNRLRLMNSYKSKGLMNNNDIVVLQRKLKFIDNSNKSPPTTVRKGMNSNNVRKSPYI